MAAKPAKQAAKTPAPRQSASTPAKRSTSATDKRLIELKARLAEIADLHAASAILHWDQATYMPSGGAQPRGRQCATLARIAHAKQTDVELGRLLDRLFTHFDGADPASDPCALVRIARRDYERAIKVPPALVEKLAVHTNAAYTTWARARPANDFDAVLPHLERGLALSRDLARALGRGRHVMDPLIDASEPGMTVATVRALFDELRPPLVALLARAKQHGSSDDACLRQTFDPDKQVKFALKMADHFGFDLTRGRLDLSPHPFCTTFALGDVRITTRVKPNDLSEALYSTLHETGHALYEQGVASEFDQTPLAGGASPGVHESQSRLWENIVGRGDAFITYALPHLQKHFPGELKRVSKSTLYRAINRVAPSLIRTDADELSYNLHIMIRFELECALIAGDITPADLPHAWAERYDRDLGVSPPDHSSGCLQDVHWFGGPIGGAFQSYTIGNILSAQFYDAAVAANPSIPEDIAEGRFAPLHGWLRENIYRHGRKFDPADLVMRATGQAMSTAPYLNYLEKKYTHLFAGGAI